MQFRVAVICFVCTYFLCACELNNDTSSVLSAVDTIPPLLSLNGPEVDTLYLFTKYSEQGVMASDGEFGLLHCVYMDNVKIHSTVNNRIPGSYHITYNLCDSAGNASPQLTRTVNVVPHPLEFLNGAYKLVHTTTVVPLSAGQPTISTEHFTATVNSASSRNSIEMDVLKVGAEFVLHTVAVNGKKLEVWFYSSDYAMSSSASGTLSADGKSFTINSVAYPFSNSVKYYCESVYTKRLVLDSLLAKNHK